MTARKHFGTLQVTCDLCGKTRVRNPSGGRKPLTNYCSQSCRVRLWEQRNKRPSPLYEKPRCACGGPATKLSPVCVHCRRQGPATCKHCGAPFYDPNRTNRTCSPACASARQAAIAIALRSAAGPVRMIARRRRAARRRDRVRAVGGRSNHKGRWKRICAADGWICWICGGPIDADLRAPHRLCGTVDHVLSIAAGGSDGDDNVRAAHMRCNAKRGGS